MISFAYRARYALGVSALALGPALVVGCNTRDQLLAPENPGVISPTAINSPAAADAVRSGALVRLKVVTGGGESFWLWGGLLTDEWKSSDTFSQRNETDQRSVQTSNANITTAYNALQQARGFARDAINALTVYEPTPTSNIGQMYFAIGFEELTLADNFCNGTPVSYTVNGNPVYSAPLKNTDVYTLASAHLDTALTLTTATDAATVAVRQEALIAKARVLVNLGQYAAAAALVPVTAVPTSYQSLLTFDLTTGDNGIWNLNASAGRYTVSDSIDAVGIIQNAIPFASTNDPRVPTLRLTSPKPFDGSTPLFAQEIWQRDDPIPLVSGIDARLIEAEARLNAPDIPGMMAILNALRTTSQTIGVYKVPVMAALPTPATQAAAVALFFREAAYWTFGRGQRLPNLRRMVRAYGLTQLQVFPQGAFLKGGSYGPDVNFPVPDAELTNPNFHGCLDRNA
jgi:starch-binding outer membrane protein, SusD/RagB family